MVTDSCHEDTELSTTHLLYVSEMFALLKHRGGVLQDDVLSSWTISLAASNPQPLEGSNDCAFYVAGVISTMALHHAVGINLDLADFPFSIQQVQPSSRRTLRNFLTKVGNNQTSPGEEHERALARTLFGPVDRGHAGTSKVDVGFALEVLVNLMTTFESVFRTHMFASKMLELAMSNNQMFHAMLDLHTTALPLQARRVLERAYGLGSGNLNALESK